MARYCIALDFEPEINRGLAQRYQGIAEFVKIGPQNIFESGLDIVSYYKDLGFKIFLDFKFHDIPNTISRTAKILKNVDIMTLHLAGGKEMFMKVKEANPNIDLAGVGQLTSLSEEDWLNIGFSWGWAKGIRVEASEEWPVDYFVMSSTEFDEEKPKLPVIIPGIRMNTESNVHDQKRVSFLSDLIKLDFQNILVLGRILHHPETLNYLKECQ
jgi:orotidine-5'-phosphate decarboxylase